MSERPVLRPARPAGRTSKRGRATLLRALARSWGVQTWYVDAGGTRRYASSDALLATLHALGAPVDGTTDLRAALDARQAARSATGVEPVHVAWNGHVAALRLRHELTPGTPVQLRLEQESGEVTSWSTDARVPGPVGMNAFSPCSLIRVDRKVQLGYHRLEVETPTGTYDTFLIAAPRHAHTRADRAWGTFAPLYAIHSASSWGVGDLGDLRRLCDWTAGLGGRFVGTLPLLASFLDSPFDPSPYAPVSRLFWNELYVDLDDLTASAALSGDSAAERAACRASGAVDYRRVASLKRRVLADAARDFFTRGGDGDPAFVRFLAAQPRARDYAEFRAVGERQRTGWQEWPERQRRGEVLPADYAEDDARYHLFAQFTMDRQLTRLGEMAQAKDVELYLDLPLGVHGSSYDVWRERPLFATDAAAGAPPDALFSGGQNWGFPPLNPEMVRRDRYRYVIETIRHHLRHAGMLRLDHVMALQRLYWIPHGLSARDGVYVRYPAEEWLALLTLESHRHLATIIGEDLGTVPRNVRSAMDRHRIRRMFVVQFEASADAEPPLPRVPRPVIASLNTHDMPPFAAYWGAADIDDQHDLGLVDAAGAQEKREARARLRTRLVRQLGLPDDASRPGAARQAMISLSTHLAASEAAAVVVNLEDLWLEERTQNVPGTAEERPNWRRRLRPSLEEFTHDDEVLETIGRVDRCRDGAQ